METLQISDNTIKTVRVVALSKKDWLETD